MNNFHEVPEGIVKQIREHGHDQPLRDWVNEMFVEMICGSNRGELSTACYIDRLEELAEKMKAMQEHFDYHEANTN